MTTMIDPIAQAWPSRLIASQSRRSDCTLQGNDLIAPNAAGNESMTFNASSRPDEGQDEGRLH